MTDPSQTHPVLLAAVEELRRATLELEKAVRRELGEQESEPGPLTRGLVVVEHGLSALQRSLQDRNMLVIIASGNIDAESRSGLLLMRVLITMDEAPHVRDASSFCYGLVSLRLLCEREPDKVAKVISDAFVQRSLWNRRHGWLLVLRDDGGHEYTPMVD